jgi:hypothetical protein
MRRRSEILLVCSLLSSCLRGGFYPDAGSSSSDLRPADGPGDTGGSADARPVDAGLGDSIADLNVDAKGFQYLYLEAESGDLVAPFAVRDDPQASGGKYLIDHAETTGKHTAGEARYTVTVLAAGTFHLWGRCRAPATDVDSFFVAVDEGPTTAYHTSTRGLSDDWTWTVVATLAGAEVTPVSYTLGAGDHAIVLSSRESQSKIDLLLLTDDPSFTP